MLIQIWCQLAAVVQNKTTIFYVKNKAVFLQILPQVRDVANIWNSQKSRRYSWIHIKCRSIRNSIVQKFPYKKFLANFLALLAWPWQSMICQQSQQILADFILAFLAFVGKKLYLPRIVGSTGGLLPSELADLAIYLTKAYCQYISAHFC